MLIFFKTIHLKVSYMYVSVIVYPYIFFSLQSTSKYERYANDAISVLAAVINRSKTDQNTSFIELVNTISFSGASVS